MRIYRYRGIAQPGRRSRRWVGLWTPEAFRNLQRPKEYRLRPECKNHPGRRCHARGLCRDCYDRLWRPAVLGMAPRMKVPYLSARQQRMRQYLRRVAHLPKSYVAPILRASEALKFFSMLEPCRLQSPLTRLG